MEYAEQCKDPIILTILDINMPLDCDKNDENNQNDQNESNSATQKGYIYFSSFIY